MPLLLVFSSEGALVIFCSYKLDHISRSLRSRNEARAVAQSQGVGLTRAWLV